MGIFDYATATTMPNVIKQATPKTATLTNTSPV